MKPADKIKEWKRRLKESELRNNKINEEIDILKIRMKQTSKELRSFL